MKLQKYNVNASKLCAKSSSQLDVYQQGNVWHIFVQPLLHSELYILHILIPSSSIRLYYQLLVTNKYSNLPCFLRHFPYLPFYLCNCGDISTCICIYPNDCSLSSRIIKAIQPQKHNTQIIRTSWSNYGNCTNNANHTFSLSIYVIHPHELCIILYETYMLRKFLIIFYPYLQYFMK